MNNNNSQPVWITDDIRNISDTMGMVMELVKTYTLKSEEEIFEDLPMLLPALESAYMHMDTFRQFCEVKGYGYVYSDATMNFPNIRNKGKEIIDNSINAIISNPLLKQAITLTHIREKLEILKLREDIAKDDNSWRILLACIECKTASEHFAVLSESLSEEDLDKYFSMLEEYNNDKTQPHINNQDTNSLE